ncbi:MAG: hypothetical protein WBG36_05160 [Ornithinimicrobium sp.]
MSDSVQQRPSDPKMAVLVLLSFFTVTGGATIVFLVFDGLGTSTLLTGIGVAAVMSGWMWFRNRQMNREDRETRAGDPEADAE